MTIESLRILSLAALLMGLPSPSSADAARPIAEVAPATADPEVRVVNNHPYRIRVVLVDAEGRHTSLGRVAPSRAEVFPVDASMLPQGPVRVKVFADEPVWSPGNTGSAIRSQDLFLHAGGAIYVWVESDLLRSQITATR